MVDVRITAVQATDDHSLLIDFEQGNRVTFSMKRMVETIPYMRLSNLDVFRAVRFEDKAVYWDPPDERPEYMPMRITVDEILFSLR